MTIRLIRLVLPLLIAGSVFSPSFGQTARPDSATLVAQRDEALAYAVGLQAYIYGYPALDYERVMREQTTQGGDPHGVYAPVNQISMQADLAEPGGLYAGRAPNTSTIYFTAWLDLRAGPVLVEAPDTKGRYYALTYADLYSEVQHTGRRTTGTGAQRIMVVGPDWKGETPTGTHLIRLKTNLGYLLGRVLVEGPNDSAAAKSAMGQFRIKASSGKPLPELQLASAATLTSIDYFTFLNSFLKDNPRLPGEEALMAQFDQIGIGPHATFDPQALSPGVRKGLERAVADGHAILANAPFARSPTKGWGPLRELYGQFGFDYLRRATVEYNGFLGNLPEESVYPSALSDSSGAILSGSKRYRIVFPAGGLPPTNAFWALNAYDLRTVDLIPNPIRRYSIGDLTPDLKHRADGAVEIRLQKDDPQEGDVNWLPVGDGPFMLTLRVYQPKPAILRGSYVLPAIEALP